jgi:predicted ATP-grasp superfamily ATP-dependent carboligase
MRIVVLDGNENQTVAAVRSLAAAGHTVVVGAASTWSKAGWSRGSSGNFIYPAPEVSIDAFIERIIAHVKHHPGALVLPMTERTTIPISSRRDEIIHWGGRLILPPHETVMRAFDKQETTRLAEKLGIVVPRTTLITTQAEAAEFARTATYPVVLKARTSEEMSVQGGLLPTGAPQYAGNAEDFGDVYNDLSQRCSAILIQEFIEGNGLGYFALSHEGELRAEFAHRRIRDVRPTGSGSALRESVQLDPRIRAAGLEILRALKWHGVAMVEFRQRPDGTPVFLEVNGRFWNSLPLAIYAGVDFPALLAQLAEHGDIKPQSGYRIGVRCRWFLGDFRHLIEVWHGPPKGYRGKFPGRLRTTLDFLKPVAGTYHDNFTWRDPLPEVGDWLHFALRKIPARFRKKVKNSQIPHAKSSYSLP